MRHPGSARYPQTGWTMTTEKTDAVGPGRGGRMSRQRKRYNVILAGHLDARVLGAVSVGTDVWSLAFMTAAGVMLALPPVVAQLDGARRRHEVGPLFRQAAYLAAGLGVLL